MRAPQALLDALIDEPVVIDRRMPGHAAEQAERFHIGPLAWIIHESSRQEMQGVKGEAVLRVLRALCNEADAAGSACPKGENAGLGS